MNTSILSLILKAYIAQAREQKGQMFIKFDIGSLSIFGTSPVLLRRMKLLALKRTGISNVSKTTFRHMA